MRKKLLQERMIKFRIIICWILLGILAGLLLILVSPLRELLHIRGDLSDYVIHPGALGALLVLFTIISRTSRLLKSFLITAGASAVGWPISLYLHDILFRFFPTEPITYILVFFVLPMTFLVGVLGAIIIGIKQSLSAKKK